MQSAGLEVKYRVQDLRLVGEWEEDGNYHRSGVENLLEKSCFGDLRPRGIG